jgi:hypothetical protein
MRAALCADVRPGERAGVELRRLFVSVGLRGWRFGMRNASRTGRAILRTLIVPWTEWPPKCCEIDTLTRHYGLKTL